MPDLMINRDSGRKPYLSVSKGIDGGYVDEMLRGPQKADMAMILNPPMTRKRSSIRGEVIGEREVIRTITPVQVWIPPLTAWGLTIAPNGDMYTCCYNGDIYCSPSSAPGFVALGQTTRAWYQMTTTPNGDIYATLDGTFDVYRRVGGVGDFGALGTTPHFGSTVAGAPNGDVYMTSAMGENDIYCRAGNAGDFVDLNQTHRGYRAVTCAPNGDVYFGVWGGSIYLRAGGVGNLVDLVQTARNWFSMASAPNGDIFASPVETSGNIYRRAGGVGDFELFYALGNQILSMAVSSSGYLYVTSFYYTYQGIHLINIQDVTQPPKNTLPRVKAVPENTTEALYKNLKPYANKTYEEMNQYALPTGYTGRGKKVESEKSLPVLVNHIEEVFRYCRLGDPIVVSVPTDYRDPVAKVEVDGGGDGTITLSPGGLSIVYKPGSSKSALLKIYTKSGQQCTATLISK